MKTANPVKHYFINAQKMHKAHPNDFYVPPKMQLDKIRKGSIVKVCAYNELFWVKVSKVEGEKITGVVDNFLLTAFLDVGDKITFEKRNVYNIWAK